MKNQVFLVEVYDNFGNLYKRRISDNLFSIEDWVESNATKWDCPAYNWRVEFQWDDFGNCSVVYHITDYECKIAFTIKTTNIATI